MNARSKILLEFLSANPDMLTPSQAARVRAMREQQAPFGALGVVEGWVPVSSAEALCGEWEGKARDYQRLSGPCYEVGKIKFTAIANTLWACAAGLRRQMAAATVRQPAPNIRSLPAAQNSPL